MFRSNLFDIHAARCGGHEYRVSNLSIDGDSEVELFPDIESFFNEDLLYAPAFRSGLSRYEVHTDHPSRNFCSFIRLLCPLPASALSSSAGMNLGLHYNSAANPMSSITRFFLCISYFSAGDPDVIACQNLLRLVLVYLHPVLIANF